MTDRNVVVSVYSSNKMDLEVKGLCLGYVTPIEFNALIKSKNAIKSALGSSGNSLADLEKVANIDGLRLVIAASDFEYTVRSNTIDKETKLKQANDMKTKFAGKKRLFVTEQLDYVQMFPSEEKADNELAVSGKLGAYITVSEDNDTQ